MCSSDHSICEASACIRAQDIHLWVEEEGAQDNPYLWKNLLDDKLCLLSLQQQAASAASGGEHRESNFGSCEHARLP